jgi:hypothetical protein
MKSAKSAPAHTREAAVEAAKPTSVETAAATPAVRPGISEIWLAERCRAQQSSCDY